MATDDEVIKLIVAVQGQKEAADLRENIVQLRSQLLNLGQTLSANDPKMVSLGRAMADASTKADKLEKEFGKIGSNRDWGRSILEGSRALEDLQYGVAGVLNNIPGLISALGGSAGLAGVVSGVAVGATVLYRNWDTFVGALGGGKIESEADALERLGKAISRTADEEDRYLRLKRQNRDNKASESAGESLSGSPGPLQAKAAKSVSELITGQGSDTSSGMDRLLDALRQDRAFVESFLDKEAKQELDDLKAYAAKAAGSEKMLAEEKIKRFYSLAVDGDKENPSGKSVREVLSDPAALGRSDTVNNLRSAIQTNRGELLKRGMDPDAMASKLEDSTPEAIRAKAQAQALDAARDTVVKGLKLFGENLEKNAKELVTKNEKVAKESHDEIMRITKEEDDAYISTQANRRKGANLFHEAGAEMDAREEGKRLRRQASLDGQIGAAGEGQLAAMTGFQNPVAQFLAERRQAGLEKDFMDAQKTPGRQRRFMRRSVADQNAVKDRINDAADKDAIRDFSQFLLNTGQARTPAEAMRAATAQVGDARKLLNGETGDKDSEAREKQVERLEELNDTMQTLIRGGVTVKLN